MGCYVLLTYPVLACPDLRLYSAEHKNMRKMAPTTMIRLTHPTIAHTAITKHARFHHIFDDVSDVWKVAYMHSAHILLDWQIECTPILG